MRCIETLYVVCGRRARRPVSKGPYASLFLPQDNLISGVRKGSAWYRG